MRKTSLVLGIVAAALTSGSLSAQEMQHRMDDVRTMQQEISSAGVFDTPVGATEPGVLSPGGSYEVSFEAVPGARLSFATMFVHSNDWFYGTAAEGLGLFDANGSPRQGEMTEEVFLWNAGTEVDQTPGEGMDQAPRQAGPDTGARDPANQVRKVNLTMHETVPATDRVIRVTLTHKGMGMGEDHRFALRIENVATAATLMTSSGALEVLLAPGVWVVHGAGVTPLFGEDGGDRLEGLEALAEDGDPSQAAAALEGMTAMK